MREQSRLRILSALFLQPLTQSWFVLLAPPCRLLAVRNQLGWRWRPNLLARSFFHRFHRPKLLFSFLFGCQIAPSDGPDVPRLCNNQTLHDSHSWIPGPET